MSFSTLFYQLQPYAYFLLSALLAIATLERLWCWHQQVRYGSASQFMLILTCDVLFAWAAA